MNSPQRTAKPADAATVPAPKGRQPDDPERSDVGKAVDHTHAGESEQPAQPNDRDESVGMTGGQRDPVVEQAHRDLSRGLQDTSRGKESDQTYRDLKKPD